MLATGQVLRQKKILVVEDEFLIAEELAEEIRDLGAYVLGPVRTPMEALRLIERETPDCVVLNAILQGAAATELVQHLRKLEVPYVVVTGYPIEGLPSQFRESISVIKPHDQETLQMAIMKAMLQRQED